MKQLLALLLAAAAVLPNAPGNAFFRAHRDVCAEQPVRCYVATEERELLSAPYGLMTGALAPDRETPICWLYTGTDGSVWGYCDGRDGGWLSMHGMLLVYDALAFSEEYADALVPNDARWPFAAWEIADAAVYCYPGGPFAYRWIGLGLVGGCPKRFYRDGDGRLWGELAARDGQPEGWICLDCPLDDSLGSPARRVETDFAPTCSMGYAAETVFRTLGTAVLVAGTAAALSRIVMKRRGKNNGNEVVGACGLYDRRGD